MGKGHKNFGTSGGVSHRWIFASFVIWVGLLVPVFYSDAMNYIDAKVSQPVQFRFRAWIGNETQITPQIKAYGIDDKTFESLDTWMLSIDQWAQLFSNIAANKPKAIIIDAMFSKLADPDNKIGEAIKTIEGIDVPIIVGARAVAKKVRSRQPLDQSRADFSLKQILQDPGGDLNTHLPNLYRLDQWYIDGPSASVRDALSIGHIVYDTPGKVAAFIQTADDIAIPYMSFRVADSMEFSEKKLLINGNQVPINNEGYIVPNFRQNYGKIRSLRGTLKRTYAGKRLNAVKEGDIVYIIPHYYTGNTDFVWTPFGNRPGGLIHLAVMDSILTGQWLKPLAHAEINIVSMIILGLGCGARLSAGKFFPIFIVTLISYLGLSLYLFSSLSLIVPWLLPMIGFAGASLTVFGRKMQQNEKRSQFLKNALEGSVADAELKKILKNPDQISFEPRERVVTLVFVDVVGFSKMAEDMLPRMAFDNLKDMLATIGDMVHDHGGIIDRTLGDGLLAYFGYRFDQDKSTPDHAEQALRCMIEIQEWNLANNIEAAKKGEHVSPLRIGINTASCYLGNLGSTNRIDFTVVGNGVNFAKRLEGACEMHSVLMGSTTNDLIKGIGIKSELITKRFIRIKHHSELVESYEYDPFYDKPELRYAALEGFRKCANIERLDQRWPVSDPSKLQVKTDFGDADLINFSHTGFSLRLSQLLTRGTSFNITFDAAGGALSTLLAKEGIEVVHGEVRWGYDDGNGFVHGVMMNGLSEEQSDRVVQYLCEFAFSNGASNKAS